MPASCKDIRAALAECLSESPCVMAGNSAADCLREPLVNELPTKCQQLKRGYGDCKRGMIDMRKRFRGNKPVGSVANAAGVGSGEEKYIGGVGSGMLYAGFGRKEQEGEKKVAWGAEEDAARGQAELVPDRFKEMDGGYGLSAGYTGESETSSGSSSSTGRGGDREGAGWSWWRGS